MKYLTFIRKVSFLIALLLSISACSGTEHPAVSSAMSSYVNIMQGYEQNTDESRVISSLKAVDLADAPADFKRAWQDETLAWVDFRLILSRTDSDAEQWQGHQDRLTEAAENLRRVASQYVPEIKQELKVEAARERVIRKLSESPSTQ